MPRYLVVDDSRTVRLMVADALRAVTATAEVVEAADGPSALKTFDEEKARGSVFDLIFLDMIMPGEPSGLAVLTSVLDKDPSARIAIVSALPADHPDLLQARAMGAFAVLGKPVRLEAVRDVVGLLAREGGRMRRIG